MMKKIYFLTSEIIPFAENYFLATFSKELPLVFIDRKYDFRLMMPKYSFISERRYILREVIRLREMDVSFRNTVIKAAVKSAFIPNTKVQVYFLEHEDYFNVPSANLYLNDPLNPEISNLTRLSYFSFAALTTLNYLRWKPEIIICNDWQMSLIPLLLHSGQIQSEYLQGVKILQIIHSPAEAATYSLSDLARIGITDLSHAQVTNGRVNALAAALPFCDHTLFINYKNEIYPAFLQDKNFSPFLKQKKGKISSYTLTGNEPEDWQKLADEIVRIMEKI